MSITGYNPATVSTALTAGTYRHVALSISGTWHTLYLDGSMVAQNLSGGNIFASYTSVIPNIYIGCAADLSYGLTGAIDDFKIWNRVLPATDISAIYWSQKYVTAPTDYAIYYPLSASSGNQLYNGVTNLYDGTLSSTASISTTQYIFPPGSLATTRTASPKSWFLVQGNYTITNNTLSTSIWFYYSGSFSANPQIFDIRTGGTAVSVYVDTTGKLNSYVNGSPIPGYQVISNQWTHFAWVINGTSWTGYINGQVTGIPHTGTYTSPTNTTYTIGIGNNNSGVADSFPGFLQDFRVYNRVLTAAEVTSIYNYRG